MSPKSGITLQINLSPGDLAYASQTIPKLALAHQSGIEERLAIVDCCRPQRTKFVDPDRRFPESAFYQRVDEITALAETFKRDGYFDRVVYVRPGSGLIAALSSRYLGGVVSETHDAGACGLMSYLAAFEEARTRFLLHYDADMLLYQAAGYDWAEEATGLMSRSPQTLSACPRSSPPHNTESNVADAPSLHEGRPLARVEGGWLNDWFSTRCFLMDLRKLSGYLPLIDGMSLWATRVKKILAGVHMPPNWYADPRDLLRLSQGWGTPERILKYLMWRYCSPIYPLAPEILLFHRVAPSGGRRLNLSTQQAWLLHPSTKPHRFVQLLPEILRSVAAGEVPDAQRGHADIILEAWEGLLEFNTTE